MAPPRTFDPAQLRALMIEHPTWTNGEYAEALSDALGIDVTKNAVAQQKRWIKRDLEAEGVQLPSYEQVRLVPWENVPRRWAMHMLLRYVRACARIDLGPPWSDGMDEDVCRRAEDWRRAMRLAGEVVDIRMSTGEPYARKARPEEYEGGELLRYTADPSAWNKQATKAKLRRMGRKTNERGSERQRRHGSPAA